MPFGPTNAPVFYSAIIRNFKYKWDLLFTQMLHYINTLGKNAVSVTDTDEIYLNKTKLVCVSRTIIDDILLFCRNLDSILIHLECVYKFFQISSQLQTRQILLSQNSSLICQPWPHQSGELSRSIKNWPYQRLDITPYREILIVLHWDSEFLPSLCSLFEIRLKPLQKFLKQYYHKPIPPMAWTPQLITLFLNLNMVWPHPQSWPSLILINLFSSIHIGVQKGMV